MEATSIATAVAGPSNEIATPAAYEEDGRHGQFAISTSAASKSAVSLPPLTGSSQLPEIIVKDVKTVGTRFYDDCHDADVPSPRLRSSRLFKNIGEDTMAADCDKRRPLCLLDLPMDILKDIVREVTHTNDLTSLALCHSALHQLAIPHIYSRFDIVWPERESSNETRSGVDALTYGLATLVMAEEVFGEAPAQRRDRSNRFNVSGHGTATDMTIRRRRGNHYAHFTKKFSLGNGPSDWVQEYLIAKEGGKMLGTLVALAVARMRSLETFVWDMPTGILRDVWLALSSLGDREDTQPCKLEKVWIRYHDNTSPETTNPIPPPPPPPPPQINTVNMPPPLHSSGLNVSISQLPHPTSLDRIEHPSFSALPPLKSLSVLDIDELAYLDEMAVLIGKSLDKLRELRVGIARHAMNRDWVTPWEGETLQQVDHEYPTAGCITIGEKRLGGVLGTLTGFVHDMRKPKVVLPDRSRSRRVSTRSQDHHAGATSEPLQDPTPAETATVIAGETSGPSSLHDVIPELPDHESEASFTFPPSSPIGTDAIFSNVAPTDVDATITNALSAMTSQDSSIFHQGIEERIEILEEKFEIFEESTEPPRDVGKPQPLVNALQLESLELERIPISVPVLQKAIDWTRLTSLTLLHCPNHEQLWKTLRRTFCPTPKSPTYPLPRRAPLLPAKKEFDYPLKLKKVHTNTVSTALISFLKETLAPNSLETLLLQEARNYSSTVQIDAILRGPLRRHRSSLKKLLIDSSEKGLDGLPAHSSRWKKWILRRDALSFVCGGKMPALRELGMALDYRDWHFFLQHLPSIPHLRSLYIPFLADHPHGVSPDAFPRELGEQFVDIVALRPEVELCYMGIADKCFEILENRKNLDGRGDQMSPSPIDAEIPAIDEEGDDDDDDDDAEEVDDDDDENDEEENDTESEEDDIDDDTDSEIDGSSGVEVKDTGRVRLREILFYDDKVAIFKARHGRL